MVCGTPPFRLTEHKSSVFSRNNNTSYPEFISTINFSATIFQTLPRGVVLSLLGDFFFGPHR